MTSPAVVRLDGHTCATAMQYLAEKYHVWTKQPITIFSDVCLPGVTVPQTIEPLSFIEDNTDIRIETRETEFDGIQQSFSHKLTGVEARKYIQKKMQKGTAKEGDFLKPATGKLHSLALVL
ncbi:hypothetical protein QAD02_001334 [Eretmocerus hayati]|uniref:Uncharacterized protein n=1 Tax=Eretmocerus hayati TaxID=131215 RepID=A0ACC2NFV0_9HYME|nr:hypothetical protein QAD02_001334 [Eretmocerus hayati]